MRFFPVSDENSTVCYYIEFKEIFEVINETCLAVGL